MPARLTRKGPTVSEVPVRPALPDLSDLAGQQDQQESASPVPRDQSALLVHQAAQ